MSDGGYEGADPQAVSLDLLPRRGGSAAHQRDHSLRFRDSYHGHSAQNRDVRRHKYRHSCYDSGVVEGKQFGTKGVHWHPNGSTVVHEGIGSGRAGTDREVDGLEWK